MPVSRAHLTFGLLLGLGSAFRAAPALADALATGSPSTLLNIDDGFIENLNQPTALAVLPDGRMVITLRTGGVMVRPAAGGALVTAGSFAVNSSAAEQGVLNVLEHPNFATNRLLFFYYSAASGGQAPPAGTGGGTDAARNRVVSIELGSDNKLVMSTQRVLIDELRGETNHVGGALSTYGDYLFVGVGDSTDGDLAKCFSSANGKVLRVHLDGSIPVNNPLEGKTATACVGLSAIRKEIWAWGLRNPWRVWADPKTGNVWVGDVGNEGFEEIDVIPKAGGGHFGWPSREATTGAAACTSIQPSGDCIDPVYFCAHPTDCASITGGVILNSCEWPAQFEGRYVFGDFDRQRVWTLGVNGARNDVSGARADLVGEMDGVGPVHFVEHAGALYIVAHSGNGHITRVSPKTPDAACTGSGSGGTSSGGTSSGGTSSGGRASGGTSGASTGVSGEGGVPAAEGGSSNSDAGESSGGDPSSRGGAPGGGGRAGSGAGARAGGSTAMGGSNPNAGGSGEGGAAAKSGCGCRVAGQPGGTLTALLAGVAGLGLLSRRRKRSQR